MITSTPLLALIGPSASGKTTVARALAEQQSATLIPVWTTRPPRSGADRTPEERRFVPDQVFDRMSGQGIFQLAASHPGTPYRFGLSRPDCPRGIAMAVLRVDEVGALADHVRLVYQICAPIDDVAERLRRRGTAESERRQCLGTFHAERVAGTWLSHRTFVNRGRISDLIAAVSHALTIDLGAKARSAATASGQLLLAAH